MADKGLQFLQSDLAGCIKLAVYGKRHNSSKNKWYSFVFIVNNEQDTQDCSLNYTTTILFPNI